MQMEIFFGNSFTAKRAKLFVFQAKKKIEFTKVYPARLLYIAKQMCKWNRNFYTFNNFICLRYIECHAPEQHSLHIIKI